MKSGKSEKKQSRIKDIIDYILLAVMLLLEITLIANSVASGQVVWAIFWGGVFAVTLFTAYLHYKFIKGIF